MLSTSNIIPIWVKVFGAGTVGSTFLDCDPNITNIAKLKKLVKDECSPKLDHIAALDLIIKGTDGVAIEDDALIADRSEGRSKAGAFIVEAPLAVNKHGRTTALHGLRSRDNIVKTLQDTFLVYPKEEDIDILSKYFASSALICSDEELLNLYKRAKNIPKSKTRASIKENYENLILDDIMLVEGGRAELIRAFRDTQALLVKVPIDSVEALAEIAAFEALGNYNPDEVSIIGPVRKLLIHREFRDEDEIALEMPILTCSLAMIPQPVSSRVLRVVATSLVNALNFIHSKNIIHGDIKISNILINGGKLYLADFGSSVKIGEKVTSTTYSLIPENLSQDNLLATKALDWFQVALVLARLKDYISHDSRTSRETLLAFLAPLVHEIEEIRSIMSNL